MPFLRGAGRDRGAGPTPFTSDWIKEPPAPPRPRRVSTSVAVLPAAPAWLPSERVLSALLVLALVCATALSGGGETARKIAASPDQPTPDEVAQAVGGTTSDDGTDDKASAGDAGAEQADVTDGAPGQTDQESGAADAAADQTDESAEGELQPTPTAVPTASSLRLAQPSEPPADGSILPYYRIISYYGQPHDANMGILGEYGVNGDIAGLHQALLAQAAEYELVDPTRPVKLAFEIIATVAQGDPMSDGSWLLNTDDPTIQEYVDYAQAHDMLVILDVQIGRRGVAAELDGIRRWLEYPHVHVALDPEFAMREGQVPGIDIGQIDASDILYAQQYLVDLTTELGLPPKVLIVHQFYYTMIENKDQVAPVPGVQLVIDCDGWGPPELKRETYSVMNTQRPIEYNGMKLFYRQDDPLMTPADVVALNPIPDLVIYQ